MLRCESTLLSILIDDRAAQFARAYRTEFGICAISVAELRHALREPRPFDLRDPGAQVLETRARP